MSEQIFRVYDSRDDKTLFKGNKQQCINFMESEVTIGESEYVWFKEIV